MTRVMLAATAWRAASGVYWKPAIFDAAILHTMRCSGWGGIGQGLVNNAHATKFTDLVTGSGGGDLPARSIAQPGEPARR